MSVGELNRNVWGHYFEQLPTDTRDLSDTVDGEGHRSPWGSCSGNLMLSSRSVFENIQAWTSRVGLQRRIPTKMYFTSDRQMLLYCSDLWTYLIRIDTLKYSAIKLTFCFETGHVPETKVSLRVGNSGASHSGKSSLNFYPETDCPVCDSSFLILP
jgi:hypothetical protein